MVLFMDNTNTVNAVVVAVKARGAERFSNVETLAYETQLQIKPLRRAIDAAVHAGLIGRRSYANLGVVYFAV